MTVDVESSSVGAVTEKVRIRSRCGGAEKISVGATKLRKRMSRD
jgi:hypothetical protein